MGRIPRYQRLGVRARQPQSIDYAGFRGQAQTSQAITRAFDQMSGFLYKSAEREAVQTGLERVRAEGAQPILEELQAQGGPRGLQERTAYEAANRVAVAEIRTEAELEITKILDQGQANKQSYSAIQAKLKDVSDGFPAALSNIDPVSAGLLRTQLQEATGKAELRYSKWWTGEIAKQQKIKQNNVAANEAEFILGNAVVPGYTTQAIDDDIAKGEQTLIDLGVKPELVEAWSDDIKEKAYKENFLFDYNQKPIEEKRQVINSIMEGKTTLPGMDYEKSVRFVNGLLRPEYNRNLSALKSQSDFVVNKVDDLEDILESGGRVSQDVMASLRDKANDVAEFDGGAALGASNQLQESELFFSQLRGASLSEVEAMVVDLQDGADGVMDTAIEVKRYEQASKFLTNMRTQLAQDPMGYAERVGFIERKSFVTQDENGALAIDDAALEERALAAATVQRHYGLAAPKLLFADEARTIGLALQQSEGNTKLQILGALADFGEASGQVLTDIADYSPELALVGGLVNAGSTRAANLAVAGFDRIKAGQKPMYFTDAKTDPVYRGLFGQAITTPKHAQAIKGVAKAIYLELSEQRGVSGAVYGTNAEDLDTALYEEALQLAAGYREVNGQEFGGVQQIRGKPTFIPPSMTGNDLNFILENFNAGGVEKATGQKIDEFLAQGVQGNDSFGFRNIGGNKYVIAYGNQGLSVLGDNDGNPVVFNMMTLKDSMLIAPQPFAAMEAQATAQPAQPMTVDAPDLPGPIPAPGMTQRPEFPEAKMVSRAQRGKLNKMIKDAGVSGDEFRDRVQPLMSTARDNISDDRYLDYVQSLLTGYNKSFSDWEKENP